MREGCVDVVVIAYKSGEDLECLIYDLSLMSTRPHRLLLFDNTGNPKTLTGVWNEMAAQGDSEFICFLNTDIRVSPDWDHRLATCLEERENVGAVLGKPVGHDWPIFMNPPGKPYPNPATAPAPSRECMGRVADLYQWDKTCYRFAECNSPFYAVMIRRRDWEELKGFDERFRFYGQDHDFQRRLKSRSLATLRVNSCPIWHRCSGSVVKAVGEVDFPKEQRHCGEMNKKTKDGEITLWDALSDEERHNIRQDPLYNRIPRPGGR